MLIALCFLYSYLPSQEIPDPHYRNVEHLETKSSVNVYASVDNNNIITVRTVFFSFLQACVPHYLTRLPFYYLKSPPSRHSTVAESY